MHTQLFNITKDTKMCDLVNFDHRILLVLARFNIPLGFGDKTIKEICEKHKTDFDCFACIAQFIINPDIIDTKLFLHLNPSSVLHYLRNSHVYFLDESLPDIRRRLEKVLKNEEPAYHASILKFFDDYFNEVREHMDYENNTVFPYIDTLIQGNGSGSFTISEFESHHSNIEEKITDLKNLIIKYIPLSGNRYEINRVLFDLFLSEEDLNSHCFIEDKILTPLVRKIEKQA